MLKYLPVFLSTLIYAHQADFITYEWLVEQGTQNAYTDHIVHFRKLFSLIKPKGLLECGCGYSTKYFLDNCEKVTSIEFFNTGNDDHWFNQCLKLYQDYDNWRPLGYNQDRKDVHFNNACAWACSAHKDYAVIDPTYLYTLDRYFKNQLKMAQLEGAPIDVAFVDPGVYIRGDMVKLFLLNQVPVVVAHDTACDMGENVDEGIYVWFVAKTPPEYEKIALPYGCGTTFWIHEKLPHVIEAMKAYRAALIASQSK
jgi:hypothetical protein